MLKNHLWKVILVLAVIGLSLLAIYPPKQKLKPGLDLAGGTTLVYEVSVPENEDARRAIDQTISVLRDRVDPAGVRNLIWRQQAGNRIEIQMALPPKETRERRQQFLDAQQAVLANNLSERQIESALRAGGEQRSAALDRLAGGDAARRQLLGQLASAYDAMMAARQPYEQVQQQYRQLQGPAEAVATQPATQPNAQLSALEQQLQARTRAFLDARRQYEAARSAVLGTNIEPAELEHYMALPVQSVTKAGVTHPRQEALDQLLAAHPGRAQQIQAFAAAYANYEELKIKSPLEDPNDLIQLLKGSGVLEFRIAPGLDEVADVESYRQQLRERGPRAGAEKPYRWFIVDKIENFAETPGERQQLTEAPEAYFAGRNLVGQRYGNDYYVLLANTPERSLTQAKAEWKLTNAFPTYDQNHFPAVGFQLNPIGGQFMGQLTGNHIGKPMAILLDNRVMSAPRINDRITTNGIITGGRGGFGQEELDYLVRTLGAGSIKARVGENPISIQTTGPQFGQDNLNAGLRAAVWAFILVAGFMVIYYLMAGAVASFALAMNILITLGAMATLQATFTLPGIAGLVLTIGMAVDANVLIYERIREELERKAPLKTAIRLGFEKAFSAIFDSNLTTLIVCLILGYTATADIRGFGVTLGIGLVASMFTAIVVSRIILELYADLTGAHSLPMIPVLFPAVRRLMTPNFNWLRYRYVYYVASTIVCLACIGAVFVRGQDFLDIEFRSGTQVSFELGTAADGTPQTLTLADVRQRLEKAAQATGLAHLADATPVTIGQAGEAGRAHAFTIATLETNASAVSDAIKAAFADVLDVQRPISFAKVGEKTVAAAPVYPVRQAALGANLNRTDVQTDVSEYLGGVAIVLSDLNPAATVSEITQRIGRMRLQPMYEGLSYRPFTVVGLDLAQDQGGAAEPRYRSVAVVSRDAATNYLENPDAFLDPAGLAQTEWSLVHDALQRDTSLGSVSNFSSQVSSTMKQQAIGATLLSLIAIVLYVWVRFGGLTYGLGGIIALAHDVIVAVGVTAAAGFIYDTPIGHALLLEPFRFNLAILAAVLTIIGFSINDTIVIFDRIRENRGRLATITPAIINDSLNQTMSRTILTTGTVLIAVLVLYTVGGEGVRGFAFTMLIGCISGTYSTIAIASPFLLVGGVPMDETVKATPATAK